MKIDPEINAVPAPRLMGLAPLVTGNTRLLILGSFPGAASLAAQQYYGHPQNQFWPILKVIFAFPPRPDYIVCYENNIKWLLEQGLGVWDVYASCERAGSLDSAIRNPEVNDFASLARRCPHLVAIAHNGGESFKHAQHTAALGLKTFKLPSTSPANASWSFERKRAAWREVMAATGLV